MPRARTRGHPRHDRALGAARTWGAGFPTGRKWASILGGGPEVGDRYAVGNGAEGEPGTFKDRMLMRRNPYQVVEGLAISAATVDAVGVYLAVKASFEPEIEALSRALREMSEAGLVGDVPITLVTGPEEYLFGEEKALLEVIEVRTRSRACSRRTSTACSRPCRRWVGRPASTSRRTAWPSRARTRRS